MADLISTVELLLKPQHRRAFIAAAAALIARHRDDDGLLCHEIHVDPRDHNRCLVTLRWRDEAAAAAHFESPSVVSYLAETAPYLEQPAIRRTFHVVNDETLV